MLKASRIFLATPTEGSGSAKKTDLEKLTEANDRVTVLEGEKAAIAADLVTANNSIVALEGEKADLSVNLGTAKEKITALEGEKISLVKEATDAKTSLVKAEGDLKTADERAETKLREIDARNGGTLPGKQAAAGDHTQTAPVATGTPMERLAAGFKAAGEAASPSFA